MIHVITFIYALVLGILFGSSITINAAELTQMVLWPMWIVWLLMLELNRVIQKNVPIYDVFSVWCKYVLFHRYFKVENVKFLTDSIKHFEENPTWSNRMKIHQLKTIIKLNTKSNDTTTKEHSRD